MSGKILVTGGMGYIGSHTVCALHDAGYEVVILDNLINSHPAVLPRIEAICGTRFNFIQGDVRDAALLKNIFSEHQFAGVIHFAALKSVGESVAQPLQYYDNNITGTLNLLSCMQAANLKTFVFSSSATVYGNPDSVPIREDAALRVTNPYGRTKLMIEDVLRDLQIADAAWRMGILRYFNPIGAHPSGTIGEAPQGIPNNLMPYITQVAVGQRESLAIFGNDYPTHDGTGVRDYIHVMDLARGHVAALRYLNEQKQSITVNLGTGKGISVLDLMRNFEASSGLQITHHFAPRRPGDIASCYADPSLAKALLGWQAQHDVADMCRDSWRWQKQNPQGFTSN